MSLKQNDNYFEQHRENLREAQVAAEHALNSVKAQVRRIEYLRDKREALQDDEDDLQYEVARYLNTAVMDLHRAGELLLKRAYP
jgi:hypothetical protein